MRRIVEAYAPMPKNAVDWVARVRRVRGRPVAPFRGLVVALASAAPGRSGGFRALDAWRDLFLTLGAEVMGAQARLAASGGGALFDPDGRLADESAAETLGDFLAGFEARARLLGRHLG